MNQYGPLLISVAILALYAQHMMGYGIVWGEAEAKLMDMALTLVIGYWLGSSHGSQTRTEQGNK